MWRTQTVCESHASQGAPRHCQHQAPTRVLTSQDWARCAAGGVRPRSQGDCEPLAQEHWGGESLDKGKDRHHTFPHSSLSPRLFCWGGVAKPDGGWQMGQALLALIPVSGKGYPRVTSRSLLEPSYLNSKNGGRWLQY